MRKLPKKYSQASYLFIIYGFFILVLLGIFFTYTYTYYKKNALKDAQTSLDNMCASVTDSVNTQLENISTISMNIVYSNAIKENFKEFSKAYQQYGINNIQTVESHKKAQTIHDIVTAMIGAYQSASDIKIYAMDGSCVEAGYGLSTYTVNLGSLPWYEKCIKLNGKKLFTVPEKHTELPSSAGDRNSQYYLSLIRLFLDSAGQPEGIVEVIQDCNRIFFLAEQFTESNPDTNIYVYNSDGICIYPFSDSENVRTDLLKLITQKHLEENQSTLIQDSYDNTFLLDYQEITSYDWTVVLTRSQNAIYESMKSFRKFFIIIGIGSIILTTLLCLYISRRISVPLQKLTRATRKITINRVLDENKVNLTSANSNIKELSILCEAIRNMYEKLRSTSQEVLLSRNEETRAKLQATQSLINPHFLYNSLTNISIMAEENMNDEIIQMCQALCDYFRYVSSSGEMIVTIKDELFYTRRYLECMKLRFEEDFEYTMDIPEEAASIYIPKLICQPIVENAFKYAFIKRPPWKLHIRCEIIDSHWWIYIEDNGGTMTEEKKEELLLLYENLNWNEELKSMKIGGMGLKNVYLRLKLLYGKKAILGIDDSVSGKTTFILGGPVFNSKEEYYAKDYTV